MRSAGQQIARTCEKSAVFVLLLQVALIVFLAHVGSYVPADEAIIGLTDRFESVHNFCHVVVENCRIPSLYVLDFGDEF